MSVFEREVTCRCSGFVPVEENHLLLSKRTKTFQSMNIYFCGSIRGGRQDVNVYQRIVKKLLQYGSVLTEHVSYDSLSETGDSLLSLSLKGAQPLIELIFLLNMYPSSIVWCANNCE